jgi:hypothetical protein
MWLYDGEEWTHEGGSEQQPNTPRPQWPDEFVPELQVIEIVHVPVPDRHIPMPFPLPLP